mgnify:CR=1 FL=1
MRQAVALLLPRDGRILAISRGVWRPWDLGLPGGKVELGETLEDAVVRETFEAIGIYIRNPTAVYTRKCAGPTDFETMVFMADWLGGWPRVVGREGWVRWVEPARLCKGTFGEYNDKMLAHVRANGLWI